MRKRGEVYRGLHGAVLNRCAGSEPWPEPGDAVVPQGAVDAAIDTSYPVAGGGEGFLGCWNMHPHQPHKDAVEVRVDGALFHGGCRPSFRELKNQFTRGWGWGLMPTRTTPKLAKSCWAIATGDAMIDCLLAVVDLQVEGVKAEGSGGAMPVQACS